MERYSAFIEGVDCSGKTTIGKAVAKKANVKNVGELFMCKNNPWNPEATKEVSTDHPLFIAYLYKAAIWDMLHFDPEKSLMQISFVVYRSTAYQIALKIKDAPMFEDLLKYVPKFRKTIILDASIEARQERLRERSTTLGIRDVSKNDALIFKRPELVSEMSEIIKEKAIQYLDAVILDTTNNTVDETTAEVFTLTTNDLTESDNRHLAIFSDLDKLQNEIRQHVKNLDKHHAFPEAQISRILEPISI